MNDDCPHYTTQMECEKCNHLWVAVHPVTGEDCTSLECPNCGHQNWISTVDPRPIHFVISSINGSTYIKPNRHVPVWRIREMPSNAMTMIENAGSNVVIDPSECSLQVIMSVGEQE